ncbi:uncharacterized protein LOC102654763 isoform X2 [Apis mellifera]|uniref:Uncharacterized protein LOC102654763 isoform X2 n=1 Tax=Apis mellifera TaxID=7460 RepID=A0A7M7M460_APIME|nr:uncharacterized protein LOC102654763 isoform X2 [Apis mellifera]|eukprot:XP_016767204.1 uncharacterized protein LOC102654763 isoform X2 [Apis mellifera]
MADFFPSKRRASDPYMVTHWPAILANRNFVNDVTSAKVGAQNHRAVGNAADVGW